MKKVTKLIGLLACMLVLISCDDATSSITSSDSTTTGESISRTPEPYLEILEGDEYTLEVGESLQLNVESSDLTEPIIFYSDDESIAQVSENGLVTAIASGSTYIYAQSSSIYDSILITVKGPELTALEISLEEDEVIVGTSLLISVASVPSAADISDISYTILSGEDLIDIEDGIISAEASGIVSLQAECDGITSNIVDLRIYDFDIYLDSDLIEVDDHEIVGLRDYPGSSYDLTWWIEDEEIISLQHSEFDEIYITGLQDGETSFYLYDDDGLISNILNVVVIDGNPYIDMTADEFYSDYTRADSYIDAMYRTECDLMSGWIEVPDQEPTIASDQPEIDGKLIHNSDTNYSNQGNTYTVVDSEGNDAFEIYYGAAYTSLEEVAAYIYAWGDVPVNYSESKDVSPLESPWGEYLRLNNSYFSGDVSSYPYEPELPDISGCGGNLVYYEVDIGTTGTDCDPSYPERIYNDGESISRGAARIVYSRYYADTGETVEPEDCYVFYTYNHYNDFQEYLNYENGWGEMFGNITGGGEISSRDPDECDPTPYVETIRAPLN